VDVQCDYSPGICSEGGTGVIIAKAEGTLQLIYYSQLHQYFHNCIYVLITQDW
jgi:hypothetical protein